MGSKHIRGDVNIAWPAADIAVMGPKGVVHILFREEIEQAEDPEAKWEEFIDELREEYMDPRIAASKGFLDDIIEPPGTRRYLGRSLDMLSEKVDRNPSRKHGIRPL